MTAFPIAILEQILIKQDLALEDLRKIMSGLTDLSAAIVTLQNNWTKFLADLQTVLANTDSDVAVEQASQLVAQQAAAIAAEDATVTGTPPA